jgi:hypothetical protein
MIGLTWQRGQVVSPKLGVRGSWYRIRSGYMGGSFLKTTTLYPGGIRSRNP